MSTLPTHGLNVQDFGTIGDGIHDDAPAIQQALDAGNELVVIPFGTYRIARTLRLHSNTRLWLHPLACIRFADGAGKSSADFLITNSDHRAGNHAIEIDGGIWDGNNPANPRGPDAPDSYTGVAINFMKVRKLTLRNLRVRDAESYNIRIGKVRDFCIEHIQFEAQNFRPNQDGVHVCGFCEDGIIRHISARGKHCTNDDLVALLADDAMHRAQNLGGKCGPIRRLRIENLSADDCHSFLRLASVWSPISDIEVNHVNGGCRCNAVNADALRYCRVPVFDKDDERYSNGVGLLENIELANFQVHRTGGNEPLLLLETRMKNFRIRDFKWNLEMEANAQTPTLRMNHLESAGILIEGIAEADMDSLRRGLPAEAIEETLRATPMASEPHRIRLKLIPGQEIKARCPSFDSFTVETCAMKEFPAPPKDWPNK